MQAQQNPRLPFKIFYAFQQISCQINIITRFTVTQHFIHIYSFDCQFREK